MAHGGQHKPDDRHRPSVETEHRLPVSDSAREQRRLFRCAVRSDIEPHDWYPSNTVTRTQRYGNWFRENLSVNDLSVLYSTFDEMKAKLFKDSTYYTHTRSALMTGNGPQILGEGSFAGGIFWQMFPVTGIRRGRNAYLDSSFQPNEPVSSHLVLECVAGQLKVRNSTKFNIVGRIWPVHDFPFFLPARVPRSYDRLVDGGGFGVLSYTGTIESGNEGEWPLAYRLGTSFRFKHPSEYGGFDSAGKDFYIRGLRQDVRHISIQRRVARPSRGGSSNLSPYVFMMGATPILALPDNVHSVIENIQTTGWWQTNKATIEAGGLTIEDGIRIPVIGGTAFYTLRFLHLTLAVEFYNNMAAMINSIVGGRPLDQTAAQFKISGTWYSMQPPNSNGPFNSGTSSPVKICPKEQYSDCLISSVQTVATFLGIPIKTLSDCPNWDLVKNTHRRYFKATYDRNYNIVTRNRVINYGATYNYPGPTAYSDVLFEDRYTVSLTNNPLEFTRGSFDSVTEYTDKTSTSLWPRSFDLRTVFGVSAPEPTSYQWITITDVKTKVEALGYKFHFERFGIPKKLDVINIPAPLDSEVIDPAGVTFTFTLWTNPSMTTPYGVVPAVTADTPPAMMSGTLSFPMFVILARKESNLAVFYQPASVDDANWMVCCRTDGAAFSSLQVADIRGGDESLYPFGFGALMYPNSTGNQTRQLTVSYSFFGWPDYHYHPPLPFGSSDFTTTLVQISGGNQEVVRLTMSTELMEGIFGNRFDRVPAGDYQVRYAYIQNASSTGYPKRSRVIMFPVSWFEITDHNFSSSDANARLRSGRSGDVYPLAVRSPSNEATYSMPIATVVTYDLGPDPAHKCYGCIYFKDETSDLNS
jgi:hypothetical protein